MVHPYPVYNCNCFISSEPVLHALLFHLRVYACMHACMYVYFNHRRKLVFLQLHRLIAQNGYNMLPPTPRELYGGGAFALTRGTQSLRLSREAVTQRKPPPRTKDSWVEPGCMARPRNPCPLKELLYLLNERRHLSAVLLGKLDSNLLNLLKAACSLLQGDNAPSEFPPSLHFSSNRRPHAL